jgi:hypothetical protein
MSERAHEHDTVKLLRDSDGWPAGTIGVVVSEEARGVLIEVVTDHIADEDGLPLRTLIEDLFEARYEDLEIVARVGERA